jgi:hypothetical protein
MLMRRYFPGGTIPKSIRPGRVLVHNQIVHTVRMPCGVNGFRCWSDVKPPSGFIKCPCGWSGLPHYASRGHIEATKGKCMSASRLAKLTGVEIEDLDADTCDY